MTSRWARTGLALAAVLAFAGACSKDDPEANVSPTATTAPAAPPAAAATGPAADALRAAVDKTNAESFRYSMKILGLGEGSGAREAASGNVQFTMDISEPTSGLKMTVGSLRVGSDTYLKLDLGPVSEGLPSLKALGDKWVHIDESKLSGSGLFKGFSESANEATAENLVKGVVSAEQVSPTEIKGTMDVTRTLPSTITEADLAAAGELARKVPFTATLDSQGRLTRFVVSLPAMGQSGKGDIVTTYSDFGAGVTVKKPAAGDTVEAPTELYQMF